MARDQPAVKFDRLTDLPAEQPTLIEGLPGLGMVASIAADQITKQLGLEHHGTVRAEAFPPVASFSDGQFRDPVRVYAGADPDVMTLQSDIPIPPDAFTALSRCVHTDLAEEFDRAIFLAGAPADDEEQLGEVTGVATSDALASDLQEAGITLAEGAGAIGGVTGAIVSDCYQDSVPAAVLIVRSNPYIPDPGAAESVIENAIEPLVQFDIDTSELREQASEIRRRMQQIAQQLQQYQEQQDQPPSGPSMYQ